MDNKELAKRITDDLFGEARHLRQFTDFPPDGNYLAGWGRSGAQTRIEHLLAEADVISRQAVADVLAALPDALPAPKCFAGFSGIYYTREDILTAVYTTIAKLGLAARENYDK